MLHHAAGESHPRAKLTEKIVLRLREMKHRDPYFNCAYWGRRYNVTEQAIWFAVNPDRQGGTWRHLKRWRTPRADSSRSNVRKTGRTRQAR